MKFNSQVCAEIKRLRDYVKIRNIRGLRELSNYFTSDLMIFRDFFYRDLSLLSIILAKILEKPRYWKYSKWKDIVFRIEDEIKRLDENCDAAHFGRMVSIVEDLLSYLNSVDKHDRRYIDSIIHQARIKIGASLYAQGVSLGKSSYLSGAAKDDILRYSGNTLISDRFGKTYSILERVKHVRGLFRYKS